MAITNEDRFNCINHLSIKNNTMKVEEERNCLRCGKPTSQHYEKDDWACYTWDNFFLEIAKIHYSEREQWAKDNYTVPKKLK